MDTATVTVQPVPYYEGGYKFPADDISSFLYYEPSKVFIISIKSLHDFDVYYPDNCDGFLAWLQDDHRKPRYGKGGVRLIPLSTEKRPPVLVYNAEAKKLNIILMRNRKMFALHPLLKQLFSVFKI